MRTNLMIGKSTIAIPTKYSVFAFTNTITPKLIKKLLVRLSFPMFISTTVDMVKSKKLKLAFSATNTFGAIHIKDLLTKFLQQGSPSKTILKRFTTSFAVKCSLLFSTTVSAIMRKTIFRCSEFCESGKRQILFARYTMFHIMQYTRKRRNSKVMKS